MGELQAPSFQRPPVVERVFGVQFVPLQKWQIPHFGLFWHKLRDQFPDVEVHPPLASTPTQGVEIQFSSVPAVRCWYKSKNGSELLQVQHDRFFMNWRRVDEEQPYSKYYESVRPEFVKHWKSYLGFLNKENLGEPEVIQCEITYVNHIPRGDGWEVAADWDKVFTICGDLRGEHFLPNPESRRFALNYPMPNDSGSLDALATRAIRTSDSKEIIEFKLIARGRPKESSLDSIMDWMDTSHDWVVKGFAELTRSEMHKRWGRER